MIDAPAGAAAPSPETRPVAVRPATPTPSPETRPVAAAAKPPEPEYITTGVGSIKLKGVPAGTFLMGSPSPAHPDEKPQHSVRITRSFYLGVYEVTQAQYAAVMGQNPSYFSPTGAGKAALGNQSSDRHPVERVEWFDAIQFCNKLSEREGLVAFYVGSRHLVTVPDWNGPGYRLPTEAEWEYACRAGSVTRYSFGDDGKEHGDYAWFGPSANGQTHPVGQKTPNAFGLFDMHGNVAEWCWDAYHPGYYQQSPAEDPRGPNVNSDRIYRGGSWKDSQLWYVRSARRTKMHAGNPANGVGFRLARGVAGGLADHAAGPPQAERGTEGSAKASTGGEQRREASEVPPGMIRRRRRGP